MSKCESIACDNEAEFYNWMDDKICHDHMIQAMEEDEEQTPELFTPIEDTK